MFGILEKISHWLVSPMLATGDMSMGGLNLPITKPVVSAIKAKHYQRLATLSVWGYAYRSRYRDHRPAIKW